MGILLEDLSQALIQGRAPQVKELVSKGLEEGTDPQTILNDALIAGMAVIGKRFKNDEIFLPEVMIAARAMHAGLDILEPILSRSHVQPKGKIVLGTVQGDLHDVGKNLVAMMFRGAGFHVTDLGIDVAPETFVQAVKEEKPDILGLSALLTMTLPNMKKTVAAVQEEGLFKHLFLMVGGAPVTQAFADEAGAQGYAPDAASAVDKALELMGAVKRSDQF